MKIREHHEVDQVTVCYQNNHGHLRDELKSLDLLIRFRTAIFQQQENELRRPDHSSMYISPEEVDHLLKPSPSFSSLQPKVEMIQKSLDFTQKEINAKVEQSMKAGIFLALPKLAKIFSLSSLEIEAIIICLAPELQRKYDKLYAYLQDDITRKKPSVDLILDLVCPSEMERWNARAVFSSHSTLFRAGILQLVDDHQSPSGSSDLARFLKLDPRILNYLLGNNEVDEQLLGKSMLHFPQPSFKTLFVETTIKRNLLNFTRQHLSNQNPDRKKLVFHFCGPHGVGKKGLALGICSDLNIPLLTIDLGMLLANDPAIENKLQGVFREGLLQQAALFLQHIDTFLKDEAQCERLLKILSNIIEQYGWITFISGEERWPQTVLFKEMVLQSVQLSLPEPSLQKAAWQHHLCATIPDKVEEWAATLASQFRFTPGQILEVVQNAENQKAIESSDQKITLFDLFSACRKQSNQNLNKIAIKINVHANWNDLILPENQKTQLKEICDQVKHRARVFEDWGFDNILSYGKGLSALFSGPPGTGKTLAAEVIAHALELDLYKMDLSTLVSKYIGETEKNLSKVFKEAQTSNAILFFDEADALFGKRTEVSDAHDRYANIETSYLLQKMEEYEGIVILATNLRDNMDEAFTRRIRFIIEFPFPNAASRLEIWKRHFPKEAPVSASVDYALLSKQVQVSGGNIKNIVLNAAFLAAENGQLIGMEHLIHGTQREFEKIGKLWDGSRLRPSNEGKN